MSIADIGPRPQAFDLETETLENPNYRTVAWSGNYLQVTLMSIPVNGDIGLEKHPETDQFIRLDRGRGRAQMGPGKDELTFDQEVTDGWCVIVPAGSWHNVTNIGDEPMQVYTVDEPQHHKPGKVQQTKAIADADTDDKPTDWSVQPKPVPDKNASSLPPAGMAAFRCAVMPLTSTVYSLRCSLPSRAARALNSGSIFLGITTSS